VDVRPIEAPQEGLGRTPVEKPRDDLGPRLLVRGCGKGGERYVQRALQRADPEVVGAEVVAPLADAMRFVHGDQARADAPEERQCCARGEPFGRHVKELQPAFVEACEDGLRFLLGVAGSQRAGLDPGFAQAADLVAHERDEGGDHDGHAAPHERGQLEAERFAAAGRHDGQRVAPRRHGGHDFGLARPEGVESEDGGKKLLGACHHWVGCSFCATLSQRPGGDKVQ